MAIKSKKNNKRKYMIKILIMDDSRPKTEAIKRYLQMIVYYHLIILILQ